MSEDRRWYEDRATCEEVDRGVPDGAKKGEESHIFLQHFCGNSAICSAVSSSAGIS